jgi:hypothetical protein
MTHTQPRTSRPGILLLAAVAASALSLRPGAQESYSSGQNIAPAYEGWERNDDGSFNLVFGYFNRNWEEEIDAPVGAANSIEPGGPDQGQPTHFLPRRNRFVFRIRVGSDFGAQELVWTLTTHGKTERAYATLKPDYFIDDGILMANTGAAGMGGSNPALRGNTPPSLKVEGEAVRKVRVGQVISLAAVAADDGIPKPRAMPRLNPGAASRFTIDSATGLRLSWFVYRGRGTVTFDPVQTRVWEDTRDGANSPWAYGWRTPPIPPGGRWTVDVTFTDPGEYVLRCLAHDGGLATASDVAFVVTN